MDGRTPGLLELFYRAFDKPFTFCRRRSIVLFMTVQVERTMRSSRETSAQQMLWQ
jgi:hypothetical protein